jgi:hypothetical protein
MRPILQKEDVEIIRYALSFLSANLDEETLYIAKRINWEGTGDELDLRIQDLRKQFESLKLIDTLGLYNPSDTDDSSC